MRKPAIGAIPALGAARINFDPPLAEDELPVLLAIAGKTTISMEISPEAVILTNLTGTVAPFLLAIVPQHPQVSVSLASIFEALRQKIGG